MLDLVRVAQEEDRDTYFLNMGPQHPSTHGVLRLRLHLRGELILSADPIVGYSHRAHEKMAENRTYLQFLPNTSRIDYLSGMIYNLAWCQWIERALGIEVPPRAVVLRVLASELNRISSHLLWFGTYLLDLGGVTPFLYCFDDREVILDLLDRVSGSRLTYCWGRFGGVSRDADDAFLRGCADFVGRMRSRLDEYDRLVTGNVIFRKRTEGVGIISPSIAAAHALSGPCLRALGVAADVRRDEPYGGYEKFEFDVVTASAGDCLERYRVRLAEIEQSLRIIEQALRMLPDGPVMAAKVPRKVAPPKGEHYFAVESARGHFGILAISDGTDVPVRVHLRTPSFANLAMMRDVLPGTQLADTVAILGSIDVVMPEVDR